MGRLRGSGVFDVVPRVADPLLRNPENMHSRLLLKTSVREEALIASALTQDLRVSV